MKTIARVLVAAFMFVSIGYEVTGHIDKATNTILWAILFQLFYLEK